MDTPICRKCRYDLAGLPTQGQCPECGNHYNVDQRRGIITNDPQERGEAVMRWVKLGCLGTATLGLLVCGGVLSWLLEHPTPAASCALIALVMGLGAAYVYYDRPE